MKSWRLRQVFIVASCLVGREPGERPARIAAVSIQHLLDVYIVLFGLAIGSYLNVVIFRLPRQISTVLPRSRCPRCRAAIRPWDNVPLFSYLILRGRCRHCGARISWRYPLVEVLTAVCFLLSARRFESLVDSVVAAAFCCAMIVLAMIDLEHFILPDVITKPGMVAGFVLQFWVSWSTPWDALIGMALGAGVIAAVSWGWYWLKGVHGMGFGDVKMLAMVGAFLGWQGVIGTLLLGCLTGSLAGAVLMLRGRAGLGSKLPFGVFLALGAVVFLFYGGEMTEAYLDFTGMRHLTPVR